MPQIADPKAGGAGRIVALDGLRGLMTLFVVVSHYFAELPGGVNALMFGWVGVDMFFVLSGYLVGKLILEKSHHANFFSVFYVRRTLRIIPAYVVTVLVVSGLMAICDPAWSGASFAFPLWSYLTFSQPFFMISTGTIGAHWLAPTWTLALEEHFYLVAPLVIVLAPRRLLPWLLGAAAILAVAVRLVLHQVYPDNPMPALVLLPSRADLLCLGILAAVAMTTWKVNWPRFDFALRLTPLLALVAILGLKAFGGAVGDALMPLAMAIGCAAFLLARARRARSPALQVAAAALLRGQQLLHLSHPHPGPGPDAWPDPGTAASARNARPVGRVVGGLAGLCPGRLGHDQADRRTADSLWSLLALE